MENKSKFTLSVILLAIFVVTRFYFLSSPSKPQTKIADQSFGWKFPADRFSLFVPSQDLLGYSSLRSAGGIPQGLPVRLKIPIIGVDSAIEDAFITQDGKMDVPAGSVNVAWFALGPHPGDVGSAVIGGHYGIENGVPFVFYDLSKLKMGDKVYVENDKGETLAFQVRSIKLFNRNDDATAVFTSSDGLAHLNLITCEGIWNESNGNYPERRVVFTDAIPEEGKIIVTKAPPLPPVVATTLNKIQHTVAENVNVKPTFPTTAIETVKPNPTPVTISIPALDTNPNPENKSFLQFIKSLYGNRITGTITSLVLLAIVFLILRIVAVL